MVPSCFQIRRPVSLPLRGCGALLLAAVTSLSAQDKADESQTSAENSATNALAMKMDVRRNIEGTYLPYRYAFVTAGPEKFTFLIPETYRTDTTDPTKIKLASADYSAMVVLGLTSSAADGPGDAASLRQHVLARYPNAVVNVEQSVSALGQMAPAVDFSWKTESGITRKTRTILATVPGGAMEFTLTASPEKFDASLAELNLVLLTFRTSSNGKFDYVIGSKYP